MRAFNIEWDLTDINGDIEEYVQLPTEIYIPSEIVENYHVEEIADLLSDEYGYCVKSFKLDEQEEDLICPYCNGRTFINSKNGLIRCLECGNELDLCD